MIMDANRGIKNIEYDLRNNPVLIQFSNGSQTAYLYTATGEKLRTIHRTAPSFVISDPKKPWPFRAPFQRDPSSMDSSSVSERYKDPEIVDKFLSSDSTDYLENFIFENGKPDKYLFNGGYYTYTTPSVGYTCYHYYITDHLGNNRVVVNENDSIEQVTHYYPFGAVYANAGRNPDFQKYKYTGKELDLTHGLNTYDHGARQNYSILGVWDRVDPLAEDNYNINPYVLCASNPICLLDIDGCDTINITYNSRTNKWEFTTPIISKGNDVFNVSIGESSFSITFDAKTSGYHIDALVLEYTGDYALGGYHITGDKDAGGTGYFVTPGGKGSTMVNSGGRTPDGTYPITFPISDNGSLWRQPGVGGMMAPRGVKFHFGYPNPRKWTQGCFIISSDYKIKNAQIYYKELESRQQLSNFDSSLGAIKKYSYKTIGKRYIKLGAIFPTSAKGVIQVKSFMP